MPERFPPTTRRGLATPVVVAILLGTVGCTSSANVKKPAHSFDLAANAAATEPANGPTGIAAAIGVDLGAASGYLVGAAPDKIQRKTADEARAAAERSRIAPATLDDARRSDTADLNGDGFVTVDEVIAMQKAALTDAQIIDRLQRTGQVFILTEQQQDYFLDRGVSQSVIAAMIAMGPVSCARQAGEQTGLNRRGRSSVANSAGG